MHMQLDGTSLYNFFLLSMLQFFSTEIMGIDWRYSVLCDSQIEYHLYKK